MRRHRRKFTDPYLVPDRLLADIEAISDPNQRTIAACQANMIGNTSRTRAILATCVAEADHFFGAVAGERLAVRAVARAARGLRRWKPWQAPLRPSPLFEPASLRLRAAIAQAEEVENSGAGIVSAGELVSDLAAATLEMDRVGADEFLDLIADPAVRKRFADAKAAWVPMPASASDGDLFAAFEIEIHSSPTGIGVASEPTNLPSAESIELEPPRRRRRASGPKPVGTNLFEMGQGDE